MVVLALLVYFLGQMLSHTSNAWTLGRARTERMQNARSISDFIGSELRMALLPIDRSNTNNLQFVVNPASISAEFKNRDAIFWQTPLASDVTLGDVAQVGYFVRWDNSRPENPRANLCRFFVNPIAPDQSGPNAKFRIYSTPQNWVSDSDLRELCPADQASSYEGLFAENVLGLWVTCLDGLGQPIITAANGSAFPPRAFDSRLGFTSSGTNVLPACSLPSSVEVSFSLLDSRAADKIGATERDILIGLANTAEDAADFESKVAATPALRQIHAGLRSHQARIYLQNSR